MGTDCRGTADLPDGENCAKPAIMDFVVTDCGKDIHVVFVDNFARTSAGACPAFTGRYLPAMLSITESKTEQL